MVLTPTRPLLAAAALQRIGRPQEDPVLLLEAQITETVVPKQPWNLRGRAKAFSAGIRRSFMTGLPRRPIGVVMRSWP